MTLKFRERSQGVLADNAFAFCRTKLTARDMYSVVKERVGGLNLRVDLQKGGLQRCDNKQPK
jgi:hypothetical protein